MKLATTTGDFAAYYESYIDRLSAVAAAGFKYIDLNMYHGDLPGWAYEGNDWEKKVDELADEAAKLGVTFVQAHAPGQTNFLSVSGRERIVRATARSFEVCRRLGIKNNVVHTGVSDKFLYERPEDKERYFAANYDVVKDLFPVLEKTGVNLLIENTTKVNMGKCWFFLTGKEMKEFIEYCSHPLVHAVWDVGHAAIEGHQYQDIVDLGDDLRALHIHDNRGADHHEFPLTGRTNYDEILSALIKTDYKGYFTLEADNFFYGFKRLRRHPELQTYGSRFTAAPIELKKKAEELLYEIGKYVLETYGLFED
ncbi:MAG: sugar phosphate isomerase/epimerase [Clostridia bacterium]|nr:sugar phosphate isomerase/epimerase [Clostridia bacterium]